MAAIKGTTAEFLELYRKAESLFGKNGIDGFRGAEDYCEQHGMEDAKSRLRICRMMRNFASHTPGAASFLDDGKVRNAYLDKLALNLSFRLDPVKKHLDRGSGNVWTAADKAVDVLASMVAKKRAYIGVVDNTKHIVDVLTVFEVAEMAMQGKTKKLSHILAGHKTVVPVCVAPETSYDEAPEGEIVFCTKDGTPAGNYVGVLKRS